MKNNTSKRIIRIAMIISVLLMMLLLCGCRIRVTNNTDVTTTVTDESGMLQESYQMRRDEIGSPVAESPLLWGRGSVEEEEIEYSEFGDPFADNDADSDSDFEDDEDDSDLEDDETGTSSNTPSNKSQSQRNQGNGTAKRPSSTSNTIRVTLKLNGNGAKCSTTSIKVKKGSKYGTLPVPTRSGYKFTGWYTSESGGSEVTSNTKVISNKRHTLYAHWEKNNEEPDPKPDQPKKTYTVTFNANAGEGNEGSVAISAESIAVEEGGTYGELPTASRAKYAFTGWFTEAEGGSRVTSDSTFTGTADQTLYAHWEEKTFTWWSNEFDISANSVDSESRIDVRIDDGDDTEETFIKECKGNIAGEDVTPKVIVSFMKNYNEDDAAQKAEEIHAAYRETAPDAKIVIVSDKALNGSNEEKLLYKMMVLDVLYGKAGDRIDEMADDLETSGDYPYVLNQEGLDD